MTNITLKKSIIDFNLAAVFDSQQVGFTLQNYSVPEALTCVWVAISRSQLASSKIDQLLGLATLPHVNGTGREQLEIDPLAALAIVGGEK
jgi:hypothetical protein